MMAAQKKKTTAKGKATGRATAKKGKKLLKSLPKSLEKSEVVKNVVDFLGEVQARANDLKDEAAQEVSTFLEKAKINYKDLGGQFSSLSQDAKKRTEKTLNEAMQKLNEKRPDLTSTVDEILNKVGLQRKNKAKPAARKARAAASSRKPAATKKATAKRPAAKK